MTYDPDASVPDDLPPVDSQIFHLPDGGTVIGHDNHEAAITRQIFADAERAQMRDIHDNKQALMLDLLADQVLTATNDSETAAAGLALAKQVKKLVGQGVLPSGQQQLE